MKSIFTSIFVLFFIGTSSANHGQSGSVLNLKLFGRGDFTVMLDDVQYRWVDNYLEVGALRPGQHRLKVVETIRNYGPRGAVSAKGSFLMERFTSLQLQWYGLVSLPECNWSLSQFNR